MKNLLGLFLIVIFAAFNINTASAESPAFQVVNSSENIVMEIDMNNIFFHKSENKISIEFVTKISRPKDRKLMFNKIYAIPDINKFKVLEYSIIDLNKKIVIDESTTPTEWKIYKNDSPINQCVNYIINNFEKQKK